VYQFPVLILVNIILSHIKKKIQEIDLPKNIYSMLSKMENKAEQKFQGIEDQRCITQATIVDPRLKKMDLALLEHMNVLTNNLCRHFQV